MLLDLLSPPITPSFVPLVLKLTNSVACVPAKINIVGFRQDKGKFVVNVGKGKLRHNLQSVGIEMVFQIGVNVETSASRS